MKPTPSPPSPLTPITPLTQPLLCGHQEALGEFQASYASGRPHHAWLIAGPTGIGKATLACHLARYLLTKDQKSLTRFPSTITVDSSPSDPLSPSLFGEDEPVLESPLDPQIAADNPFSPALLAARIELPPARMMAQAAHPDFRLIQVLEAKTQIAIEQIRQLAKFTALTPSMGGWRVIIIDSADDLTLGAANALLKMLEEPPPATIFFLITRSLGGVLATIRSRCRRLVLKPLSEASLREAIPSLVANLSPAIQETLSPDDIDKASRLSHGSLGLALSLLETNALGIYQHYLRLQAEMLSNLSSGRAPRPDSFKDRHNLASLLAKADQRRTYQLVQTLLVAFFSQLARAATNGNQTNPQGWLADEMALINSLKPNLTPLDFAELSRKIAQVLGQANPPANLERGYLWQNVFGLVSQSLSP